MNTIESLSNKLTSYKHTYERVGYDKRDMTFLADGSVANGSDGFEQKWSLIKEAHSFYLDISGCLGLTCRLMLSRDGVWSGRWEFAERMPIKVVQSDIPYSPPEEDPWVFNDQFNKDDFSVVIQGPLNPISLLNISNYLKFAKKVVVSHWDYDKDDMYLKFFDGLEDVKIIKSPHNNERQVFSTMRGLELVDTKYTIKVRSDEFYADLSAFINKMLLYPEKMVTNNILFFRRTFHPSDHVFGSTTESLMGMCNNLMKNRYKHKMPIDYCMETRIALAFLEHKNIDVTLEKHDEIFKEYFDVVPVSKMGRHIWTCNQRGIHSPDDNINVPGMLTWGFSVDHLSHI
jgi:hypothetical protein